MHARLDDRHILQRPWDQPCLDVRVSKDTLDRALNIVNAVILMVEAEKFLVSVQSGKHGTTAQVFGHRVPFSLVEKVRQKRRKEITQQYSYTQTVMDYQPSGELSFGREVTVTHVVNIATPRSTDLKS
jgi:hypothetical protein